MYKAPKPGGAHSTEDHSTSDSGSISLIFMKYSPCSWRKIGNNCFPLFPAFLLGLWVDFQRDSSVDQTRCCALTRQHFWILGFFLFFVNAPLLPLYPIDKNNTILDMKMAQRSSKEFNFFILPKGKLSWREESDEPEVIESIPGRRGRMTARSPDSKVWTGFSWMLHMRWVSPIKKNHTITLICWFFHIFFNLI